MVQVDSITPSGDLEFTSPTTGEVSIYNLGDIAWVLTSMALVWLMVPGVGLFYSGLLRRKNALSMIMLSLLGIAVGSFQWFFWGYSLAFADNGSAFIGTLKHFCLMGVDGEPAVGSARLPSIVYAAYQGMFALITVVLATGGFAERARIGPVMVFIFVWLTIVYCPIATWTWGLNGWGAALGALDFAGGSPVHISSGTASLAIAFYLGKRRGYGTERLAYKPHNTTYVVLGTVFLWFGWFGFNGGSALSANMRAGMACVVTNLAASVGGLTWMLWDYRLERKWSVVGFCSGAIAGLVGITPAAGFVGAPAAVAIGFVAGTGCNFATKLKFLFGIDETLDVFASHGIGGMIGSMMTALLAQASVAGFDGTEIDGGWPDHNYIQLGYQLAEITATFAWSFTITSLICWVMHFIPGLRLRASEESEIVGIDDAYLGEFAYDYVGIDPELRLHRIGSGPTMTSGDVMEGNGMREKRHGLASSPEMLPSDSETTNEPVGGGRHDQ